MTAPVPFFVHLKSYEKHYQDPIIEGVRQRRKKHAEQYGNNLDKIFEALKKAEKQAKRKTVNFGPTPLLKKTG